MPPHQGGEKEKAMVLTVTLNPSIDSFYTLQGALKPINLGHSNRIGKPQESAGGKGINVAKVLRTLSVPVKATGFLGGLNGKLVAAQLAKKKIDIDFVHIKDDTRECVSIRETVKHRQTELLETGPMITTEEKAKFLTLYTRLLKNCTWVQIGGSVPGGIETKFYSALISQAKAAGKSVFFDASGKMLAKCLKAGPTVIKPNRDELAQLFGKSAVSEKEISSCVQELQRDYGIETVIVSLGADGAYFAIGDSRYRGRVPNIKTVSTVGCGDSLVAGYIAGREQGLSDEDTVKLALAASVANTLTWEPGGVLMKDVKQLLKAVSVKKLR